MSSDVVERLHYYPRQFLSAPAFQLEQSYLRDMRRRHNVAHHLRGIVVGLELKASTSAGAVVITLYPGLAIDGFGREILVMRAWELDSSQFSAFLPSPGGDSKVGIYVAYDWTAAQEPSPGFELCDEPNQFQVVQETFMIVPSTVAPTDDPIMVDGKEAVTKAKAGSITSSPPVPNDKSVPYQELPADEDSKRWYVCLGHVHINPTGGFTSVVDLKDRQYAGVVANRVLAQENHLELAPRDFDGKTFPTDPFVTVEGTLEVKKDLDADGDVYLSGDQASDAGHPSINFQSDKSSKEKLYIKRDDGALRVTLGEHPKKGLQLIVGTKGADALVVKDDLSVVKPTDEIKFGAADKTAIGQTGDDKLYFRAATRFDWYAGPPTGSSLMSVDATATPGRLTIGEDIVVTGDRIYLVKANGWIVAGGTTDAGNMALGFDTTNKQVLVGQKWSLGLMDSAGNVLATSVNGGVLKITGGLEVTGDIISDKQLLADVIPFSDFGLSGVVPVASLTLHAKTSSATPSCHAIVAYQAGTPPTFLKATSTMVATATGWDVNVSIIWWPNWISFLCSGIVVVR
jgi:hypothetical protein